MTAHPVVVRFRQLLLHLLLGVICVLLLPFAWHLEAQYGLRIAFWLRGDKPVPASVRYVAIDQLSADILDQPQLRESGSLPSLGRLADWDRSVFARLVERLDAAGASLIVFDVNFERFSAESPGDRQLAESIQEAGNVVLLEMPQIDSNAMWESTQNGRPANGFAHGAAAVAHMFFYDDDPLTLDYALYLDQGHLKPDLPLVMLYLEHRDEIDSLATDCSASGGAADPNFADNRSRARIDAVFALIRQADLGSARHTSPACRKLLQTPLAKLLANSHGNRFYLNFYAQQGAFRGASLYQLLDVHGATLATRFKDKVVLVGVADSGLRSDVSDDFDTIYHRGKVAGVELVATAYANLSRAEPLRRAGGLSASLLLLGFGLSLGVVSIARSKWYASSGYFACIVLYTGGAVYLLGALHYWIPLFVPLCIQFPLAVAVRWLFGLHDLQRLSANQDRLIPAWLSKRLLRDDAVETEAECLFGVCMHTDITGYSSLAERLGPDPMRLKALEREYWLLLDAEVARQSGIRLEIAGDGMTAVWASEFSPQVLRRSACEAALGIRRAVSEFNRRHHDTPFVTRIGLHAGTVALGLIGGRSHYTLAVGGDVATTAARLESDINKLLGTSVVVSDAVVADLDSVSVRRLGAFVPRGKVQPIETYELMDALQPEAVDVVAFDAALTNLEVGKLILARSAFAMLCSRWPEDGPSKFYLALIDAALSSEKSGSMSHRLVPVDINEVLSAGQPAGSRLIAGAGKVDVNS